MDAPQEAAGHADPAVMAKSGLGGRMIRGERPAIVVVDFTRGFTEEGFALGSDATEAVAATRELLDRARAHGVPIVFTRVAYADPVAEGGVWLQKSQRLDTLLEGSEAARLDPRMDPRPGEVVITKRGASGFFGTDLFTQLTARKVDTLIVCGASTSGCVRATVVDGLQYGYPVLVPREGVADRSATAHAAALADIDAKYGDVTSVEDLLGYLDAVAEAEAAVA
jgi:nicotinamidase-related amidase